MHGGTSPAAPAQASWLLWQLDILQVSHAMQLAWGRLANSTCTALHRTAHKHNLAMHCLLFVILGHGPVICRQVHLRLQNAPCVLDAASLDLCFRAMQVESLPLQIAWC